MFRAVVFVVIFVLTHASLLLLYPPTRQRILLSALLFSLGTCYLLWVLFHPRNEWLVDARWKVPCPDQQPCVALTFDDGPSGPATNKILDVLREKGVKASFFLVGRRVEEHPEIVRRIRAEGHRIGNHTYSHPSLFCFLTPSRLREEIERGQDAIGRVTGEKPRYFRSPVGLRHALLRPYLKEAGVEYISWRIRTFDTIDGSSVRARINDSVESGDIVLMHDNRESIGQRMLEVIPQIIDDLKSKGYRLVPVD
jgi:peptidoglycan/xylan/chitin deacetylase (PgdA/CDA1 family)